MKKLLPFVTHSQENNVAFSEEMEKAAVFCLDELNREKGGGFLKKQPPEKIVFATEVYYPFWVASFRGLTVLLDGLNVASHTMTYSSIPDLKAFKENLNGRSTTRQTYVNFLSNHSNYFQPISGEKNLVIEGLFTDHEFVTEFLSYLKEAKATDVPVVDSVLVTPAQDKNGIASMLRELENSRSQLATELEGLNETVQVLNLKTQQFLGILRDEIKVTEEKFSVHIGKAKAALDEKASQINKDYSGKVTEASNMFDQQTIACKKKSLNLKKKLI